MTVCVATICENGSIFGASDRMITAGITHYQPQQAKVRALTTSIVVMISGDIAVATEILASVNQAVIARVKSEPDNWWSVKDVAFMYSNEYVTLRAHAAARKILGPLGLTTADFVAKQSQMSPQLVTQISSELIGFAFPSTQVIVAGIDPSGPHLYLCENDAVQNRTFSGFATCGIGAWHAESYLMLARHSSSAALPDTLYRTYAAKRKAEIAPGVGADTDLFLLGPTLGNFIQIREDVVRDLGAIYETADRRISETNAAAIREANDYVAGLGQPKQQPQEPASVSDGAPPIDDAPVHAAADQARLTDPPAEG